MKKVIAFLLLFSLVIIAFVVGSLIIDPWWFFTAIVMGMCLGVFLVLGIFLYIEEILR